MPGEALVGGGAELGLQDGGRVGVLVEFVVAEQPQQPGHGRGQGKHRNASGVGLMHRTSGGTRETSLAPLIREAADGGAAVAGTGSPVAEDSPLREESRVPGR